MELVRKSLRCIALWFCFSGTALAQGIIVNEASNGTSGSKEFIELMVVGSSVNPTGLVDLHDWIIDDNNGEWEGSVSGVGIAPGYARFDTITDSANCSALGLLSPGSIVVVYNANDPNTNLPPDDSTDANGDGVYILQGQGSCIKTCSGPPTSSNSGYSSCAIAATPSYAPLLMRNGGDVAQARDPSAALYHGFTYGDIGVPYPAGSFKVGTGSGSQSTFLFSCGSWYDGANFSKSAAATDTPGAVNNAENAVFRSRVQAGTFNYSNLADPLNCLSATDPVTASKSVALWDGVGGGTYFLPGNDVVYSILLTNTGLLATDTDTIFLVDNMPDEVTFYNGDIDLVGVPSQPVVGIDTGSGLTLTYPADVGYASTPPADFSDCTYSPTAGYDPNVKFICLNPKGQMAFGDPNPTFEIKFRARIK